AGVAVALRAREPRGGVGPPQGAAGLGLQGRHARDDLGREVAQRLRVGERGADREGGGRHEERHQREGEEGLHARRLRATRAAATKASASRGRAGPGAGFPAGLVAVGGTLAAWMTTGTLAALARAAPVASRASKLRLVVSATAAAGGVNVALTTRDSPGESVIASEGSVSHALRTPSPVSVTVAGALPTLRSVSGMGVATPAAA